MYCRPQTPINFRRIQGTILFRSSRPCGGDTSAAYTTLGIKTVLDLRTAQEISRASCLFDHFDTYSIALDKKGDVKEKRIVTKHQPKSESVSDNRGHHVLISLISGGHLFLQAPWYIKLRMIFNFIWDFLFGTNYVHKIMVSKVLGRHGDECLKEIYRHIVDYSGYQICATLKLLCKPERVPALICCSMGKDRTGVMCAMVGHVCGKTKEEIADDYALSQEHYGKVPDHMLLKEAEEMGMPPAFKYAPRATMLELIDYVIERHGTVDAFLDKIGFVIKDREALRRNVKCDV